ncbi:hypothetical protein [Fulvivirga lutea]|uniref:Uncharacterized protein n=1 Tax=Fulvivirga lutea TaxID=2810512 RepID=A0A974WFL3_9BACT|nr:hypothetical protein [Fulvivirga lutea]QSE96122.1 hypothetical protein JR347_10890 [Fulvivirga lutea]
MMQKTNEISGVWRFISQLSGSSFSFLNSHKLLSIYEGGIKEELLKNRVEIAEAWRDGYLINETQFYSEGKIEPVFEENTLMVLIIDYEELLVKSIDYEKEEIKYGVFNFSLKDIKWLADFGGAQPRVLSKQRNLISTNDNEIKSYSLDKGNLWQQTFTDLTSAEKANLHSRVLSSDDKLFFGIDGNENRGIFVLDILTGTVLKKFDTESYEIFKNGDYIYTTKFQNVLCRINTKTLELEQWDCHKIVSENGFHSIHDHRCDVINGRFYFTQSIGDIKAKLGVLDWDKKELVYKYDFEPKNGAIGSIQVSETRMFVHTQDNILHIFSSI